MSFISERLLTQLLQYPPPTGYLVAFSGGMDSHVLLDALVSIQSSLAAPIRAIHTDHGLQPQSANWTVHCRAICDTYGLSLTECQLHLSPVSGESLEAVAREARYRAIVAEMKPGELLLTAHHQDDQAETLLLQLLRGAGLSGLASMPAWNEFAQGYHARPLLSYSRKELEAYAHQKRLQWIEDGSNQDTAFDRNYLRHEVMPLLRNRWPAMPKTLSRSARHCAEADQLLDGFLGQQLKQIFNPEDGTLTITALRAQPAHHVGPLLRAWIKRSPFTIPDSATLSRIVKEVLLAGEDRNPQVCWSGAEVRRYRDRLYLMSPLDDFDASQSFIWKGERTLSLPVGLGTLIFRQQESEGLPISLHTAQCRVRFRQDGEWCRPVGRGVNKRVKHLLQEQGVLPWMRERIPLLEIDGEIAAVIGVCLCDPLARSFPNHQLVITWDCPLIWHQ
jgi:tRNA(Ile)-lysidine synthase